jgi:hypothetical protein
MNSGREKDEKTDNTGHLDVPKRSGEVVIDWMWAL